MLANVVLGTLLQQADQLATIAALPPIFWVMVLLAISWDVRQWVRLLRER